MVRTFEHDVADLTAANPYTGTNQKIGNYLADPTEEAHPALRGRRPGPDADARDVRQARLLPVDGPGGLQRCLRPAEHRVRVGSRRLRRRDRHQLRRVRRSRGTPPGSRRSVGEPGHDLVRPGQRPDRGAQDHFPGPWVDETDIRPTIMYLTGLRDDYEHDGRVITQILSDPNRALSAPGVTPWVSATSSSTPASATSAPPRCRPTRRPSTAAARRPTSPPARRSAGLEVARDRLAGLVKGELEAAAFGDRSIGQVGPQLLGCQLIIHRAGQLASAAS